MEPLFEPTEGRSSLWSIQVCPVGDDLYFCHTLKMCYTDNALCLFVLHPVVCFVRLKMCEQGCWLFFFFLFFGKSLIFCVVFSSALVLRIRILFDKLMCLALHDDVEL